jgi:hypothetical protein
MDTICKSATDASKRIRLELKAKFPTIKFSVRTSYYSGGDSIRINWTLGPTAKAVEAITAKYQEGSFDGMTDCYNYEATMMIDQAGDVKELGGAKYVFANRDIPQDVWKQMLVDFGVLWGDPYTGNEDQLLWPEQGWNHYHTYRQLLYRVLAQSDLTEGYHGIRQTENRDSGMMEDFYQMS